MHEKKKQKKRKKKQIRVRLFFVLMLHIKFHGSTQMGFRDIVGT